MSSRYYYFAATLPSLQFGQPAPMGLAEFLERAGRFLEPGDLAILESASLLSEPDMAGEHGMTFLAEYYAWERSLRNELARLRARRLNRSAEAWLRPAARSDAAQRAAQAVFAVESPLEGEMALERERWAYIESLKGLHVFDLETLVAYRLELSILERLSRFRTEAGEAGYRSTYADILEPAQSTDMTGVPR